MLRRFAKPIGGFLLGMPLFAAPYADAQTTGYVSPTAMNSGAPRYVASPASASSAPTPGIVLGFNDGGTAPTTNAFSANEDCAPGVWLDVDYLLWWLKDAPAPGPLVNTGSFADPRPGSLGQPNTRVVLGDKGTNYDAFNGMRLQVGTWIDEGRHFGYEASGFLLEHRTETQAVGSDTLGSPFLVRPFLNSQNNKESAILVSLPGLQAGTVVATSSTRLSGWDFNFSANVADSPGFRADALLGFRAIYLAEYLSIADSVTALADQGPGPRALGVGERLGAIDRFSTSSNFYGGQIGGRVLWVSSRWTATGVVKVALGVTDELVDIQGLSTTRNGGGLINAGYLANYGSQGRYFTNQFTVVPEVNFNLGYRLTEGIVIRAGYTFMYWSDVVRPGNVDARTLNPANVPNLQAFGVGPNNQPRAQIGSTDFWAQGLNLGVEFRY